MIDEHGICIMPPKLVGVFGQQTQMQIALLYKEVFRTIRRHV
jgi:hypothetical protein